MTRFPSQADRESSSPEPHPNHHLWQNGRMWWVAFTFHTRDGRKFRVRRTLGTDKLEVARRRRDEMFAEYARRPGWILSLRYLGRTSRRPPSFRDIRESTGREVVEV